MPTPQKTFTTICSGLARVLANDVFVGGPLKPGDALNFTHKFTAIWDTGATGSVVTQKVIDTCGLKPIGMCKAYHADGECDTEVFLVSIGLPNQVAFPVVRVIKGRLSPTSGADVLIGMDIIGCGDFAVTNFNGKTVFTFRLPSCECIDFVRNPIRAIRVPGVGRNDPCPCGSGKKYKHCCGKGY